MTPEEFDNQIREITGIIEDCVETPIDDLVSNPRLGELSFEKAQDSLERIFSLFNKFRMPPIEALPGQAIQPIIQSLKPLQNTINDIKSFDGTKPFNNNFNADSVDAIDMISARLKREVHNFYKVAKKWVPHLVYQDSDITKSFNKISSAVAEAWRMVAYTKKGVKAKKDEIDKEVIAAKKDAEMAKKAAEIANKAALLATKSAVLAGVKKFTENFSREARALMWLAVAWFVLTFAFGTIALSAAYQFLSHSMIVIRIDGYVAAQLISARLIILGMLSSATVWCSRIYKAHMHQITINRHRANSIETFQAFTAAASNDVTRDAVLTETTRAIFGPSATGYLDKEIAGSGGDQLKVVEVVKQASKNLKSGSDQ